MAMVLLFFNHSERHLDNGLGSVYHPPTFRMKNRDESRIHILKQFDYIGIILYTGGLLVFLIGLSGAVQHIRGRVPT